MPGLQHSLKGDIQRFFRVCFAGSLAVHLITAWFSIGFQYHDEQSQIMEYAAYKLGITQLQNLSWEFALQMRQGIQPLAVFILFKALKFLGMPDPFFCSLVLRVLSALLGWFSIMFFTAQAIKKIETEYAQRLLIVLSAFIWFLPYIHAHFSAESISGSLFFIGLGFLLKALAERGTRQNLLLVLAGIFAGLSFVVRNQVIFMVFGLGLWLIFIGRFSLRRLLLVFIPAVLMVGVGVLADRWLYGKWVFTAYNYVRVNIIENKVSEFGVTPFYYYLYIYYVNLIPPFSILILGAIFYAWYRHKRHLLTWVCVPFFIGHSFIGHKEVRFFFPMADALPLLLTLALAKVSPSIVKKNIFRIISYVLLGCNGLLLILFAIKPAHAEFSAFKYIYDFSQSRPAATLYACPKDPYYYWGNYYYFPRPGNIQVKVFSGGKELAGLHPDNNSLICFYEKARADSFEKAHPRAIRVHKSTSEFWNYLTIHDRSTFDRGWRIYRPE